MKTTWFVVIALLFGTLATFIVTRYAAKEPTNTSGPKVIMANSTIEAGTALVAIQLKSVVWPSSSALPEGAHSDEKKLLGRVARQPILAGELVLESKLASLESKGGLASMITLGKRAISVRVNDVVGVAGFALPGNYVDVLVSARDALGQPFSKVVLSHVKVLAIAQDTTADPSKPKVVNAVTLELTPTEAEQLDLARSIGALSLVLRNEIDNSESKSTGASLKDITQYKESLAGSEKLPRGASQVAPNQKRKIRSVEKLIVNPPSQPIAKIEEIRGVKTGESAQ